MPDVNQSAQTEKTPEGEVKTTEKAPISTKEEESTGEQPKEPSAEKKEEGKKEETVTISVKKYNALQAKKRIESRRTPQHSSTGQFSFEEPAEVAQPSVDEQVVQEQQEFAKVKIGIADLIMDDDEIREVIRNDKTLARILKKNPLTLLDETPIDASDALAQLEDYLRERAEDVIKAVKRKEGSKEDSPKPSPKPAPQEPRNVISDKKDKNAVKSIQDIEQGIFSRVKGNSQ